VEPEFAWGHNELGVDRLRQQRFADAEEFLTARWNSVPLGPLVAGGFVVRLMNEGHPRPSLSRTDSGETIARLHELLAGGQ